MDARVNDVILPLASRILAPEQARQASAEGYLAAVVLHEICHGLGPAFARAQSRASSGAVSPNARPGPAPSAQGTAPGAERVDIREAIGGAYAGLEESKADVVGMFALKWLVDRDVLPEARLQEYYASYVAGIFRTVRFGTGEAHGRSEMMEFNVLAEQGAIIRNGTRYRIDYAKMPAALERLAKELLEQEASGDRQRTEAWFAKYGQMPPELKNALSAAADVPIDVDPIVSFAETVQ